MTETNPAAKTPAPEITPEHPVVVVGAGPAGLTAGYLLAKQGKPVIVLESSEHVGGIARTQVRDGYRFDLGGHRFFTKSTEIQELWQEILSIEQVGAEARTETCVIHEPSASSNVRTRPAGYLRWMICHDSRAIPSTKIRCSCSVRLFSAHIRRTRTGR